MQTVRQYQLVVESRRIYMVQVCHWEKTDRSGSFNSDTRVAPDTEVAPKAAPATTVKAQGKCIQIYLTFFK